LPRRVDQCGFGNEDPVEGVAPKSGDGGKKGSTGRGSCAATLAVCKESRTASENDGRGDNIGRNWAGTQIPVERRGEKGRGRV